MNKNSLRIKRMAGTAILIALAILFQFLSSVFKVGPFNINLAIVCIAMAAVLYGPWAGAAVGAVDGIIILFTDATAAFFMTFYGFWGPVLTILLVLGKTTLAGIVSGFAFKGLKHFNITAGIAVSALLVPLVNTATFGILTPVFFGDGVAQMLSMGDAYTGYGSAFLALFIAIWLNGVVEIGFTVVLTPAIITIIRVLTKKQNFGFTFEKEKENPAETAKNA